MVVVWLLTQADSAEAKRRAKGKGTRTINLDSFVIGSLEFDLDHGENNQYKISNISFSCQSIGPFDYSDPCPEFSKQKLGSGSLVNFGTTKYIEYDYGDDSLYPGNRLSLLLPLCDPTICPKSSATFPYATSLKENILYYPYEITSVPDGLDDITKLDNSSTLPPFFTSPSSGASEFVLFASAILDTDFDFSGYEYVVTYVPRVDTPTSENNSVSLSSSKNADSIPEPTTVAGWLFLGILGLKRLRK